MLNDLSTNIFYSFQCEEDGDPIESGVIFHPHGKIEIIDTPEPGIPQWFLDQFGVDFFYKVSTIRVYEDDDVKVLEKTGIGKQLKCLIFHAWINETRTDEEIKQRIHRELPYCKIKIERVTHVSFRRDH
ncbi:MAG: hypothetical protein JXB10_20195 [Pirellulales bacterium]|nr:hypothetical protein [Pirellulales bacterium]